MFSEKVVWYLRFFVFQVSLVVDLYFFRVVVLCMHSVLFDVSLRYFLVLHLGFLIRVFIINTFAFRYVRSDGGESLDEGIIRNVPKIPLSAMSKAKQPMVRSRMKGEGEGEKKSKGEGKKRKKGDGK